MTPSQRETTVITDLLRGRGALIMRMTLAVAVACLTLGGLAAAGDATAAIRKETHIPAEGLGPALTKLAKEFDFQVLYRTEIVSDLKSPGAMGTLTSDEALGKVLTGTGLTYKYLDDKTVTIISLSTADSGQSTPANASGSPDDANTSKEAGKKTSQSFRVAQVDPGKSSSASSVANQASNSEENSVSPSPGLAEILVTAQKRTERLQDVPVPVTAINADALSENNLPRLQDYYSSIPGFSVSPTPGAGGGQMLVIRGITAGAFTNPTVGVVIDDVPYGSSTTFTGNLVPDIDPSDLARVEVLRGPQGALYGASSMGGLLKFVTVDPSTDAVNGNLQGGLDDVYNGAEIGYSFSGAINFPLTDTLAVRASAFTRETPGYIDNPITHENGVNEEHVSGGRLSALWRPSAAFSVKLSALYQEDKANGNSDVDIVPGLGDLQQNYIPNVGGYDRRTQAYSATLTGKVGDVDLTAVSGFNVNAFSNSIDFTYLLGSLTKSLFGVSGTPLVTDETTRKFSQEIRASLPLGDRFEWLVGGFYTDEKVRGWQSISAEDTTNGAIVGDLTSPVLIGGSTYSEYAGFTDLTTHITDRFDVQIGGRESRFTASALAYSTTGALSGGGVAFTPGAEASANAFTYLLTPRFQVSPDLMLYVRLASGFRAGGPNGVLAPSSPLYSPIAPKQYDPDKTQNYEIGAKGDILNHALTFDASIYYIDWKNIQLNIALNGVNYNTNGSAAKSEGVELSLQARPATGLTIALWGVYDDAALTQNLPANSTVYGVAGNRMPFTARFSGNLSIEQDFPITNVVTGFAGAAISYVGDRSGTFIASPDRQLYSAYAKTDLRTGVKYDSWTVNVYANNVTDRRGVLGGGAGTYPSYAFTYIQPRMIGLSASKTF
jgi:iron complex outermembrane recepter protein